MTIAPETKRDLEKNPAAVTEHPKREPTENKRTLQEQGGDIRQPEGVLPEHVNTPENSDNAKAEQRAIEDDEANEDLDDDDEDMGAVEHDDYGDESGPDDDEDSEGAAAVADAGVRDDVDDPETSGHMGATEGEGQVRPLTPPVQKLEEMTGEKPDTASKQNTPPTEEEGEAFDPKDEITPG